MDGWNYKRQEPRQKYAVYLVTETYSGFTDRAFVGETMAVSPEQAARFVSYRNGDDGKRELHYNGYKCFYEAEKID